MIDIKKINEAYSLYLRPQTFPLAVRMCESAAELPERARIPKRDLKIDISLCHAITMARVYGWIMAIDKFQSCYIAGLSMGFLPLLPDVADGSLQASLGLWGLPREDQEASLKNIAKFDYAKYQHVLISPLDKASFEPHVILFYGNPAQVWVLLSAYLSGNGKNSININMSNQAGCTTYITSAIKNNEAQFAIVGIGERLIPHPQDSECVLSVPFSKIENTINGLEKNYKTGVFRYPIPGFLQYNSQHPQGYDKMRSHLLGEDH